MGVPAPAAHIGGQSSSVHPNLAPDSHELEQDKGPVLPRRDRHRTNLIVHVPRKTKRIAVSDVRIVRLGYEDPTAFRLVPTEHFLAQRRERRLSLGRDEPLDTGAG